MQLHYLVLDPQDARSCIVYPKPPDPARKGIIPVTRDWYVTGVREDLWAIVGGGQRLIVLDLSGIWKTGSYFNGVLIDVKGWLRTHHGDLRLSGLLPDLRPWFERVTDKDPVYSTRMEALHAPLDA
jgi:hypothetical protein